MKLRDQINRMRRIHMLIRRKGTGPPSEFSRRLGVSDRQMYRLLDELRSYGLPVEYNRSRQSYMYSRDMDFFIDFEIREDDGRDIIGGKSTHRDELEYWAYHPTMLYTNSYHDDFKGMRNRKKSLSF